MKAEDYRALDVNQMHRAGVFKPGRAGWWEWWRAEERVGWINYSMEDHSLRLTYRFRQNGGDWEDVDYPVPIIRKACRFGGTRPYFACPGIRNGVTCGRTVAKLFSGSRYFLCRHCYRLAYTSQSETPIDRVARKANKKRMRLGGNAGMAYALPCRPKGMWQRTYEREIETILNCEKLLETYLAAWLPTRFE